jgi:hypothetical protein
VKIYHVLVSCVLATLLHACKDDPKEPNEKNFKAALSQYLEKKGALCLSTGPWPVPITNTEVKFRDERFNQMEALASVGLVLGEDKNGWREYSLTDAAKPFLQEQKLCWGKTTPDKVVKWDGPIKLGDYQEAKVTYTYKVEAVAEWAKNPEVQKNFPNIQTAINNANKNEDHHAFKLTSQGWEALGLTR